LPDHDCPFCRIAAGEEEADLVLDEPHALAFLDHRPLVPGHCLLNTRPHRETLLDLALEEIGPFFATAQLLTRAVTEAMDAQGTFVALNNVVSQSVPHLHVHVVPRRRKDGLRGFFWPRTKYESEEHEAEVAAAIREAVSRLSAG
jgi:histidine triad (HIT) family protein